MVAVSAILRLSTAATAGGGVETLGLKAGETVSAKVLELLPGGNVRIDIAGRQIEVSSETLLKPGTEVQLRAEREGQLLKLLVLNGGQGDVRPSPSVAVAAARTNIAPGIQGLVRDAEAALLRQIVQTAPSAPNTQPAVTNQTTAQAPVQQAAVSVAGAPLPGLAPGAVQGQPAEDSAAATLQRFAQYAQPGSSNSNGAAASLGAQQRTILASIINGLAEISQGGRKALPQVLRLTAARLLDLPQPAPITAAVQSGAAAAPAPRDAVAALFASLANVISQGDAPLAQFARQAAARLLDLPAQPLVSNAGVDEANDAQAVLARGSGLFETAGRLLAAADLVPQPVRQALELLLGLRMPLERAATPEGIATALKTSGLLHEAQLLRGDGAASVPGDLKSALLVLRHTLQGWLQGGKGGSGHTPVGLGHVSDAAELQNLARSLLNQSEAHLARLRLAQFVATPDRSDHGPASRADTPDLNFQLAVADGARTALLQFHIDREDKAPQGEQHRAWSVRFSFDFEATGYTQTLVVLRGKTVRIRLRAERRATQLLFAQNETLLHAMLEEAGLLVDDISSHVIAARPSGDARESKVDWRT